MRVLLLGSGTSVPGPRAAPGLAVFGGDRGLLVDPGPTAAHALGAARVEPTAIHHVVITHFHPDHVCGLVPFLFCLRNPRYRSARDGAARYPRLIGPPGLSALYGALRAPFARWLPEEGPELEILETDPEGGPTLGSGGLRLRGEIVEHLPSSLAWRITEVEGATFAFSGDTSPCPGVVRAARDADLLFLECSAPRGHEVDGHLDPATASAVIRDSGARRVVLVHLNPECNEVDLVGQLDGEVRDRAELGRDGEWYEVSAGSG